MNGRLNREQTEVVRRAVAGRHVHDFGAGDLSLARRMLQLGAASVTAIEPHSRPQHLPGIQLECVYFEDYETTGMIDVGFVSWPMNRSCPALVRLLQQCRMIVYLGKNTDCSACGGKDLFVHFLDRELLEYVPDAYNVLIVLGGAAVGRRHPTGEEWAAISSWYGHPPYSWQEAELKAIGAPDLLTVPPHRR